MKRRNKQKSSVPTTIAVSWACFLLGVVCIGFGLWGIRMKSGHEPLAAYVAWLGSAYEPTLRGMAVLCIALGILLVYRGWTGP